METSRWQAVVARIASRIWFRLAVFTVIAVLVALIAGLAPRFAPAELAVDFGQDSVMRILQILATSMLAVTTFSLTAMISAYSSAAAGTTPRATQLLVADPTSQNALSTFLGSFVFAIVGIVALSTGYYGTEGRVVLFVGTLVVIAVIVATLMRWIHHLTGFGRMADVIDRVESAARDTACAYARAPHLGGAAPVDVPASAAPVRAAQPGCVTGIAMEDLQQVASDGDLRVHVVAPPGATVGLGGCLAHVEGHLDEARAARVRAAFRLEAHRTYEQDPRLGFVALAEIGSRALSPATNDPGSAIEALNAIGRVLALVLTTEPQDATPHDRVHVPAVELEDLIEDALRPLARDGAGQVEVALRIQRVIADALAVARPHDAAALQAASERAERRACAGLSHDEDAQVLREAASRARATEPGSARPLP